MAAKNHQIQDIKAWLDYSQEDGEFRWIKRVAPKTTVGGIAGCINKRLGYRVISFAGRTLYAHRLAWFYVHGVWPNQIDHINGVKTDNRIVNLRDVSDRVNKENKRVAQANSTSGLLGAIKHGGRWRARIHSAGADYSLGLFDKPEEAHAAYVDAKRRLHDGCTI